MRAGRRPDGPDAGSVFGGDDNDEMRVSHYRPALVLRVAATALVVLAFATPAVAQPNIVVVMTDDQAQSDVETMDDVQNSLADQGVTFANFYASFPMCCPSRATFLTGQYAHNHGVTANDDELFDSSESLAIPLEDAGYRTGLVGKYLNDYAQDDGIPPGWDVWRAATAGPPRAYNYWLNENGVETYYGRKPTDYKTDVYARKAEGFIRRSAATGSPFFLFVGTGAPHAEGKGNPPTPAPDYQGQFDNEPLPQPPNFDEADVSDKPASVQSLPRLDTERFAELEALHRARLASLVPVDALVRDVVEALRQSKELNDTYVMFTSDNGYMLGNHRREGKGLFYDESISVPMIVRGPGVPADERRHQPVANIDLAPTLIDIADTEPLHTMDGISLLPTLADAQAATGRDILLENHDGSVGVRNSTWCYAEHETGERELYNVRSDPWELESVHDEPGFAKRQASLASRLEVLRHCSGEACH